MKFKYIFIAVFSIVVLTGCENDLIEKPKRFTSPSEFFNTQAETEAALFGSYNFLHFAWIGDFHVLQLGDLGTDVGLTRSISFYNVYQHWNMENLTSDYRAAWGQRYEGISNVNLVIARVEASDFPEAFKNEISAEARFIRALLYYQLNIMYGGVPLWTDELTDLEAVGELPRATSAEVRELIISDLKFSEQHLPSARESSEWGRVTKWAAKGLLARVYLFDKQWQNAKDKAEDVITNSPHSLLPNYMDIFDFTNRFNSELVHVIHKETDIRGSSVHSFSSPRGRDEAGKFRSDIAANGVVRPDGKTVNTTGELFQGWGIYQSIKENYDSYQTGDARKDIWWHEAEREDGTFTTLDGGTSGAGGYYNLKWIAFDENPNNGSRDVTMQRLAELYLISAEADNEINNGPTTLAYSRVNELRRRAYGDMLHDLAPGMSKEDFKTALIAENRWELGGEGLRRWYLIHWGYDVLEAAVKSVSGSNPLGAANIKPHHVLFKIPDEEIIVNPNIEQNPEY
ncbi:RagB/SusD family nutrient uptake outer membrane protein [uncultured Wocania sp.]|uniref:RagB/SusD family nutrient uptake outer membrane protein n=1 Tax=uncultured Wocania sp. TaxID=2834404 RepID=UPI0030F98C3F